MGKHIQLGLLAALALGGSSHSAAPAKSVPVVTSIVGAGSTDTTHTLQSEGAGPYVHTAKRSSGVESHIQELGDYELDAGYYFASTRRLYFDFRNPVTGSLTANAPQGVALVAGRLISKCHSNTDNYLWMNPSMPLYNCTMLGRFDYNGRTLLVRMNEAAFPGTRNVRVTCTGTDPANWAQCAHWRIETCSAADAGGNCTQWGFTDGAVDVTASVMTILEETTAKGKTTTRKLGDYYMQFEIYLSKQ